ncbi:hypothetical protein WBP07_10285 [Novosphingobium sp. BL-8A]|uniref:hypothetical protein n=1 Tax=Novosphingobium sp. BL-8A TaxID=3127639 RepID=UPI003756C9B5
MEQAGAFQRSELGGLAGSGGMGGVLARAARALGSGSLASALLFLCVAIALRASTYGDPNVHGDEVFYQTVGLAMHHGAVPYVDVWDRKPWGLFFLYYLITAISDQPIAYQLASTVFAAATAWVISRIASRWNAGQGALFAGLAYLLWLEQAQGFFGQAPVWYNLFVATAALLVLQTVHELGEGKVTWRPWAAMALGGCAITIKQTSLFECAWLGSYAAYALWHSPLAKRRKLLTIAGWMLLGAAPTLGIALGYAFAGDGPIWWQAMVGANLRKTIDPATSAIRALLMFVMLAPFAMLLVLGLPKMQREERGFLVGWLAAAGLGLLSVPNFYPHYALPMLIPLCIASAGFFAGRWTGPVALAVMALLAFRDTQVLDFEHARRSRAALAELEQAVRSHDDGGPLFVYDGPFQLYAMTGHHFVTPLVFPPHLAQGIEKDVSYLSTLGEVRRVLAERPSTLVLASKPRQGPVNWETMVPVRAYALRNCHLVSRVLTPEWLHEETIDVWADCNRAH